MKSINVKTASVPYTIYVGEGIRHQIKDFFSHRYDQVMIITDTHVAPLYLDDVVSALGNDIKVSTYIIQAGESSKSIEAFEACHTEAINEGLNRHSLIIALGGGVVGDLAGFVAATYMRGIDYVQVPTTVLAHDSSVGGKVAINHPLAKNIIGSFHQPNSVIYDTETLSTLSEQEWRSGMAEIIKHAWIHDPTMLSTCFELEQFSEEPKEVIEHLLWKGISIKANIVEEDEKEHGVRSYLNFGHTLGHALEAELGYGEITHGEAVALGIDFALFLSERYTQQKLLPRKAYQQWLKTHGYPIQILGSIHVDSLLEMMKRDKKNIHQSIRFVLLSETGYPILHSFEEKTLRQELEMFKKEWSTVE
ncbi:3-dehydroquinate synthase [Pontibacillus sp. HMF3514]|uniref:3-dehydroquinate synthase n=1 Tax=Pontibacillus sp. HMF3514 TaxID=2692425 RepID=UPI00132002F2|nr:3-dehydroquinate synthase [Pontibacillus sp. HMF3514]QHE52515.1 3-dehydroquinate synthase [Pontibacillus sp. HMF3514]